MKSKRWWFVVSLSLFLFFYPHKEAAGQRLAVGYLPSWAINWFDTGSASQSQIATVSDIYTHVIISFAKPDATFNGTDWTNTGIQFSSNPAAVRAAVDTLHLRGKKALLAVGGATYNSWDGLAAEQGTAIGATVHKKALYDLMVALDLNGLDVDYEADSDIARYRKAVLALREVVDAAGADKALSLAGWSTGADCTAVTTADPWCAGQAISYWGGHAGRELQVFRALITAGHAVEGLFDFVSVMSYDGGRSRFSPITLWNNYRKIYAGPLALGMELAPESWGGAELVATDAHAQACPDTSVTHGDSYTAEGAVPYSVETFAGFINTKPADTAGVMLWSLYDTKTGAACPHAVNYSTFTDALAAYLSVRGDVNGDGVVDLNDVILALKALSGASTPDIRLSGDVDNDGGIGLGEAVYILQDVSGIR